MDNEMIERLVAIQMKHNPQTKIGAAIVVVELLQAMREPTEKMLLVARDNYQHGSRFIYKAMIDSITND